MNSESYKKLIDKGECRELSFSDQLGINPRGVFSPPSLSYTCNHPHGPCIYTDTGFIENTTEITCITRSLLSNKFNGVTVI
jgi:hypothetical protein